MACRDSYRLALLSDASLAGGPQHMLTTLRSAFGGCQWGPNHINPFTPTTGETLPAGSFRNHEGLLIRRAIQMTLSTEEEDLLGREITFLQDHVVIACFVDGVLPTATEFAWLMELHRLAAPGQVLFQRPASNGFLYI
jgi:hypothetical protein